MKKQIHPSIKAHLLWSALILLSLLAVCAIPFALAQRQAAKRSVVKPNAAANMYLGRPVQLGAAFRAALADVPRLLVTLFVVVIAGVLIWFAAIAITAIPIALTGIGILAILLFVSIIVVPFFLLTSFALVPTISALEDAGPIASIRRGLALVAGSRWRLLGVLVLLFILEIVLSSLLGVIFLGAQELVKKGQGQITRDEQTPTGMRALSGNSTVVQVTLNPKDHGSQPGLKDRTSGGNPRTLKKL